MISEQLIIELSKPLRPQVLKRLGILVTCRTVSESSNRSQIPYVSSDAWLTLKAQSPNIYVDVTIVNIVPFADLAEFLKPEIPLISINFMKFSRCDSITLQSITDKYCKILRRFTAFTNHQRCLDSELLQLVDKCPKLDYFIYTDSLRLDTVRRLASKKGHNWYYFQVCNFISNFLLCNCEVQQN